VIVLTAVAIALAIDVRPQPPSQLRRCAIDGRPAHCGTITVPEDRRRTDSRELALGVLVLDRFDPEASGEPIFVLAGGPGQAATSLAPWAATTFADVRRTRDIVLVDQRGTGGAHRLSCAVAPRTFFIPLDPERCAARLSRLATLSLYGTESFVDDLDRVRTALGYERIVLYGASYGTRAAYAYARRFPDRVRSVVLVAPAPISMAVLDSFEEDGRHALDAVVEECLADAACARAFPNVRRDVERLRDDRTDPFRALGLQFLLYSTATAVQIPRIAADAASGNTARFETAIAAFRERLGEEIAIGVHLTIICGEDLSFGDSARLTTARQQYARACREWPAASPPPDFHRVVRLSIPALIVAGEWDPVTAPHWGRVAAEQFSPSQVVVFRKTSHELSGGEGCVGAMVAAFLSRGAADPSCAGRAGRPPFPLR
jgi:pimeloyl-ACP methyl ester carboxylesterase